MNRKSNAGLRKAIGLFDIVALGLGTAVGVSIFSVLAPTTELAGPAMLLAILASVTPMVVFAIIYAFMGSALPVSGASYEWPRRFIHPFVGFFISWLRIAGSTAALIVLAFVLVSYLSEAFALPLKPSMFAILFIVFAANILGVSVAAKGQTAMLVVLIITGVIYVAASAPSIETANFAPFLSKGWTGIFAAIPLMITLFLGIETATEAGEEVKNPGKNIPLGIALAVVLTSALYGTIAFATLGVLGEEALGASSAPLLDTARAAMGELGLPLILVSATVAIGTSINAIFLIFTRYLFAMGKTGILPRVVGSVNERFGTPHIAATLAFTLCCLGLFMPSNLVFLFLAVNIPTLLKYAATSWSAGRLLKKEPELYERATFRPPRAVLRALSLLGVVAAIGIIAMGVSADWRPYVLLAGWAALGVFYYVIRIRMATRPQPAQ